ncbi:MULTISPECIES: hypothetical protein [Shewanella]|uniref:Uncharacterized protein n=1 Tax=Shewanella marisflavi TaxID=260364 RepID=A0ABX5WQ10_9GAMM|nr:MULTISPECIES: hypothetical protein [Shewanella]QDF76221.1 hypothetical protein FGA12_14295 [Shewanella marisflavi]
MTNEMDELFSQVRTAHRLLAAYYQRLLPTIEKIALESDTEFYFWAPQRFSSPGQSNSNPFKKWQWDMLPGVVTRYVFKNVADINQVTKGDYILEFIVINDSGVNDEQCRGQPDALNLKVAVADAKSDLRVAIYRALEDVKTDFYQEWEAGRYPDYSEAVDIEIDNKFAKYGFEIPLESLMTECGVASIKETIGHYLAKTKQVELPAHIK